MDFGLSEQQQKWHDAAVRFARDELVDPDRSAASSAASSGARVTSGAGEFGILGLPVPAEYGGQGADIPTAVAAMEGLGYGCPDTGLIFALNASLWTITMPILRFGTEEQKARYLPALCDGRSFGANGASEPEAGSDIFSMTTRAERRGDRWVLNGRKVWITGGPIADLFLCFATTDPSKGVLGITAFLIDRDTPGFHVVREIPKLGMRTAPMGELVFEDCELPAGKPAGPRGTRVADLQRRPGVGAGSHPGERRRHHAAAARPLHSACTHAQAVRPADRQVPVGLQPDRRYDDPARDQPVA